MSGVDDGLPFSYSSVVKISTKPKGGSSSGVGHSALIYGVYNLKL
jgi:hypothetical protein